MASHFSDIGFVFNNQGDMEAYLSSIFDKGKEIPSKNGFYRLVTVDSSIELWFSGKRKILSRKEIITGIELHYKSETVIPVRFGHWINPKDDSNYEAMVLHDNGTEIPFVVNIPNAYMYRDIKEGEAMRLQVACFAEELQLYDTEEEYFSSQEKEPRFAAESFLPTGAFNLGKSETTAAAALSGHIIHFEKRINSHTGCGYYLFSVACLGAVYTILADVSLVDKQPRLGGILQGSFWVSGKPL